MIIVDDDRYPWRMENIRRYARFDSGRWVAIPLTAVVESRAEDIGALLTEMRSN